jgi:DNA-binding response OmpR family regulator
VHAPARRAITFGSTVLDLDAHEAVVDGRASGLTRTEFAILAYLAQREGRALSREQIAEEVLPTLEDTAGRTVDAHIARLRKKLGADGRHIATVWGIGYRFVAANGGGADA